MSEWGGAYLHKKVGMQLKALDEALAKVQKRQMDDLTVTRQADDLRRRALERRARGWRQDPF